MSLEERDKLPPIICWAPDYEDEPEPQAASCRNRLEGWHTIQGAAEEFAKRAFRYEPFEQMKVHVRTPNGQRHAVHIEVEAVPAFHSSLPKPLP